MKKAICVDEAKAGCAEGLLWDAARACIWWVDISGKALHRFEPETKRATRVQLPFLISALALHQDGRLIIATAQGLGVVDEVNGDIEIVINPEEKPGNRLNDIVAAPDGTLLAGTMSEDAKSATGALYRVGRKGIDIMMSNTTISNGIDWSPDGTKLYFVDSVPGILYVFQYEAWQVLYRFDGAIGRPDGLCVDAAGTIWIALCDRGQVIGMTPDGKIIERIEFPCSIVTNCAFGGADLKTLFVTTGTFSMSDAEKVANPLAGGLFAVAMDKEGKVPYLLDWPAK